MTISNLNLVGTLPLLSLSAWACGLLLVDLWIPGDRKHMTGWMALSGFAITFFWVSSNLGQREEAFGGMLAIDGFSNLLHLVFLGSGILATLLALNYLKQHDIERGEFYPLMLFSVVGMMIMSMAKDLIVVFLALEMLSIPLYVLVGFARTRADSEESALKYFLLGAFSSAFQVYGIALIYGATQATGFAAIGDAVAISGASPLLLAGIGLMLVGLAFKVSAVPLHMWTPDVYQGAPSVVTGFMSVGAKAAGFAAIVRIFFSAFHSLAADWAPVIVLFAVLSTVIGNVAAISQTSIKRMLAFSSIAHAGYVFVAIVPGGYGALSDFAASAVIFYLAAYGLTNIGAWSVVIAVDHADGMGSDISNYAGLARRSPGLAAAMTLFMLSLTGLPPTMGFVAKFYVFRAALAAGYTWLVVVGVVTVLISAYYYLRVIVVMWMDSGDGQAVTPRALNFTVGVTAAATLVLGLLPGPLMAIVESSVRGLF